MHTQRQQTHATGRTWGLLNGTWANIAAAQCQRCHGQLDATTANTPIGIGPTCLCLEFEVADNERIIILTIGIRGKFSGNRNFQFPVPEEPGISQLILKIKCEVDEARKYVPQLITAGVILP
ncbi:hypothetical protein CcaCcLH18_14253 [Colletotrichum camelliae]|nr:hypothetical protein CcaCcLH18_14253 [Colletotrichum camelliae]